MTRARDSDLQMMVKTLNVALPDGVNASVVNDTLVIGGIKSLDATRLKAVISCTEVQVRNQTVISFSGNEQAVFDKMNSICELFGETKLSNTEFSQRIKEASAALPKPSLPSSPIPTLATVVRKEEEEDDSIDPVFPETTMTYGRVLQQVNYVKDQQLVSVATLLADPSITTYLRTTLTSSRSLLMEQLDRLKVRKVELAAQAEKKGLPLEEVAVAFARTALNPSPKPTPSWDKDVLIRILPEELGYHRSQDHDIYEELGSKTGDPEETKTTIYKVKSADWKALQAPSSNTNTQPPGMKRSQSVHNLPTRSAAINNPVMTQGKFTELTKDIHSVVLQGTTSSRHLTFQRALSQNSIFKPSKLPTVTIGKDRLGQLIPTEILNQYWFKRRPGSTASHLRSLATAYLYGLSRNEFVAKISNNRIQQAQNEKGETESEKRAPNNQAIRGINDEFDKLENQQTHNLSPKK